MGHAGDGWIIGFHQAQVIKAKNRDIPPHLQALPDAIRIGPVGHLVVEGEQRGDAAPLQQLLGTLETVSTDTPF